MILNLREKIKVQNFDETIIEIQNRGVAVQVQKFNWEDGNDTLSGKGLWKLSLDLMVICVKNASNSGAKC